MNDYALAGIMGNIVFAWRQFGRGDYEGVFMHVLAASFCACFLFDRP